MADTPSKQDLYDEAAMQDAIAAKVATGSLTVVNPEASPAPVKQDLSGYKPNRQPLPEGKPQPTAEDKAFDELAARQQSSGGFAAKEAARRAAPAADKGQSR